MALASDMPFNHSLNKVLILSVLLFFIFPIKDIKAFKTAVIQESDIIVLFEENLRTSAEEVVEFYPDLKNKLEKNLRWEVDFRPAVMLVQDPKTFQRMAGNSLIVAFAVPEKDLMVVDYSKMRTDPFSLEAIIKHELCHLLLHRNIRKDHLPRWLDEGVAQWVSDGLADIIMDKRSALDGAVRSGRYIRLKALEKGFPGDREHLILAYAESRSLVEYIIREYGRDGVLNLLEYLKDGHDMDRAIQSSFAITFNELERRWYRGLEKRATWLTFLINNLYQILFFVAALLLIFGFVRVLVKKRSYDQYEEDDNQR